MDAPDLVKLMAEDDDAGPTKVRMADPSFEPPPGEPLKVIPVRWFWGERVKRVGGDKKTWGFITGVVARPSGVLYQVSWPTLGCITDHWVFELEDAG